MIFGGMSWMRTTLQLTKKGTLISYLSSECFSFARVNVNAQK